jgi:Ca2+-binding EF-hand superfamily protein
VFKDKKEKINFEKLVRHNLEDAKKIFDMYDENQNGFIEYNELAQLFIDAGLKDCMDDETFEDFLQEQFEKYDANGDGVISYEEFIHIHNNLLDN